MKKLIAMLLALMLTAVPALAAGLTDFETWADDLQGIYGSEWKEDGVVRMLKAGENVAVSACLSGENVAAVTIEAPKGENLREVAYAALAALGGLSGGTLFALNDLEETELALDDCIIGHLAGETRECIYIAPEEIFEDLVWEPVHGGDQLHVKPGCSGMDVPRLITAEAAAQTGYDDCDHCMRKKEN